MPKKPGSKSTRVPPTNSPAGRKRSVRPAPRASTAFPVETTKITPEPALPPPVAAPTPFPRPATAAPRVGGAARPARSIRPALSSVVDYAYVLSDLRRIGLLAALAFAILIALTFVIH